MKKKHLNVLFVILLLGLIAVGTFLNCEGDEDSGVSAGWYKETVDTKNDAGLYTSIAVDPNDSIHISYFERDSFYSYDDDYDECDDNIPPTLLSVHYYIGEEEFSPPIVIKSEESAMLGIYFEYADEDCNIEGGNQYRRFTSPEETQWEYVDELPWGLGCSSEESDCYYGFTFYEPLAPAYYAGETKWTDYCADASNVMPWEFTVTDDDIDDDIDDDAGDDTYDEPVKDGGDSYEYVYYLKYAQKGASVWQISQLDYIPGSGLDTDMTIDSNGYYHISYYASGYASHSEPTSLLYASNSPGNIDSVIEKSVGYFETYASSIAADLPNDVHIAYHSNGKLKYATNISGGWKIYEIEDDSKSSVNHSSIALDSLKNVHISYWDEAQRDLKYASNKSGSWKTFTIDSGKDVGKYNDIAIDSNDFIHISYYDRHNGDLKYATNRSGRWKIYTIDSAKAVGLYTSIAIDSTDSVHISYFDANKHNLKYATNASGIWRTFTIDTRGDTGYYTSIAVDSEDFVHISYFNNTNDDLIYVTNRKPE